MCFKCIKNHTMHFVNRAAAGGIIGENMVAPSTTPAPAVRNEFNGDAELDGGLEAAQEQQRLNGLQFGN